MAGAPCTCAIPRSTPARAGRIAGNGLGATDKRSSLPVQVRHAPCWIAMDGARIRLSEGVVCARIFQSHEAVHGPAIKERSAPPGYWTGYAGNRREASRNQQHRQRRGYDEGPKNGPIAYKCYIYPYLILFQSTKWTTELSPGWSEVRAEPWGFDSRANKPR